MKHRTARRVGFALWALSLLGGCVASVPPAFPEKDGSQIFWLRYEQALSPSTNMAVCEMFRSGCWMLTVGGVIRVRSWLFGTEYRIAPWRILMEANELGLSLGNIQSFGNTRLYGFLLLNPIIRVTGGQVLAGGQVGILQHHTRSWQTRAFVEGLYGKLNDSTGTMLREGTQVRVGVQILWGRGCKGILGVNATRNNVTWRWGRAYRKWIPGVEVGLACERRKK